MADQMNQNGNNNNQNFQQQMPQPMYPPQPMYYPQYPMHPVPYQQPQYQQEEDGIGFGTALLLFGAGFLVGAFLSDDIPEQQPQSKSWFK